MKIGRYQFTQESILGAEEPQPEVTTGTEELLSQEYPILEQMGEIDSIVITMENDDFKAQQMFQQMELLQNTFDAVAESKEVTPAQVRAIAVQIETCSEFLPREQKYVIDSMLSQRSDDLEKNAVVSNESLGHAMKALTPLLLSLASAAAALFIFFSQKRVAAAQNQRAEAALEAAIAAMEKDDDRPRDLKVDDNGLKRVFGDYLRRQGHNPEEGDGKRAIERLILTISANSDRIESSMKAAGFDSEVMIDANLITKAVGQYQHFVQLEHINQQLCGSVQEAMSAIERQLSIKNASNSDWDKIAAKLNAETQKAMLSVAQLGNPVTFSSIRDRVSGDVTASDKLQGFSLYHNATGAVVTITDQALEFVRLERADDAQVILNVTPQTVSGIKNALKEIGKTTQKVESESKSRKSIAAKIDQTSKNVGRNSSGGTIPQSVMRALMNSRKTISSIDRVWLSLCSAATATVTAVDLSMRSQAAVTAFYKKFKGNRV